MTTSRRTTAAPYDAATYPTAQLIGQAELFTQYANECREEIARRTGQLADYQSRLAAIHTELAKRSAQ